MPKKILPPKNVAVLPDEATKTGPDYTGPSASQRVFHFNFGFMKYGTHDRVNGTAILLSILVLVLILITVLIGAWATNAALIEKVLTWAGGAFLFLAGVAAGRSAPKNNDDE